MATVRYELWTEQDIKAFKATTFPPLGDEGLIIGKKIIELLEEVNNRHNAEMQKKDRMITYLKKDHENG